jgi:hypothetical protein
MEAKMCPDGSYVGRTGPNCDFSPCPNITVIKNITDNSSAKIIGNATAKLSWPIGCRLGIDCTSIIYPDINDGSHCGSSGYAGHEGTDITISWESMDKGVDVYAAMDGRVLWVFDGKYDRCVNFGLPLGIGATNNPDCAEPVGNMEPGVSSGYRVCTEAGNYCPIRMNRDKCFWCFNGGNVVVILHADSTSDMNGSKVFATRYDHLKNGSILVKPGDYVIAGQKIAEVGSAGRASGPHLHFEVWSDYYTPMDPWSDSCDPNVVFGNYS